MADVTTSKYDSVSVAESKTAVVSDPGSSKVENVVLVEGVTISLENSAGVATINSSSSVIKTITGENSFTNAVIPKKNRWSYGHLNVSVSLAGTLTVSLLRSYNRGVTWGVVDSWTASKETYIFEYEQGIMYCIGVLPGGYTTGSAICRLGVEV